MLIFLCALPFILYALQNLKIWNFNRNLKNRNLAKNKFIVISGCDSGFGYILARKLDSFGAKVLAICLKEKGAHKLSEQSSTRLETVVLDITDFKSVSEAMKKYKSCQIYALINNAGILDGSYIEFTQFQMYEKIMKTNYLGAVNLTKELIPLIEKNGRVVNICSSLSFESMPNFSAYSASKFALRSFTDTLRREMAFRDIKVSAIFPGLHNTNLLDNFLGKTVPKACKDGVQNGYGSSFKADYESVVNLYMKFVKVI
ncbi:Retinol dehydrogenase 5 [Bonamia ostreae]|uniref:Retinol dehydrogenase 5 n=1 Tax=Bonamia ostreae TaxID=126728 RepID=A0ABV2AM53_9EUKA